MFTKKKTNVRSLKELYTLLLNSLEKTQREGYYYFGICGSIYSLYCSSIITNDEYTILKFHFKKQKPCKGYLFGILSKHKDFTNNESFINKAYWWTQSEKGLQQRIKFIKYLITKV